jgi:D-alanyl-D-alanine carboxypeptidase
MERLAARAGNRAIAARVVDGSGLTREKRPSGASFAEVLHYMAPHACRQVLAGSLSTAGRDGSPAKRIKNLPGTVYAKTGYANRARALSGCAIAPQGRWRAFSVLLNGPNSGVASSKKIHGELCRVPATDPSGPPP